MRLVLLNFSCWTARTVYTTSCFGWSFLFPVQMAASADSRYEVSSAEMSIFEALLKLLGSRSVCVGGWLVGEVCTKVRVHFCLLVCLYVTLFAFRELGNKPTPIYFTLTALVLLDTWYTVYSKLFILLIFRHSYSSTLTQPTQTKPFLY